MSPLQLLRIVEDPAHPNGGHALVVLQGVADLPADTTVLVDPLDQRLGLGHLVVPQTPARHDGDTVIFPIGPALVDRIDPHTAVTLSVPGLGFRQELIWPELANSGQAPWIVRDDHEASPLPPSRPVPLSTSLPPSPLLPVRTGSSPSPEVHVTKPELQPTPSTSGLKQVLGRADRPLPWYVRTEVALLLFATACATVLALHLVCDNWGHGYGTIIRPVVLAAWAVLGIANLGAAVGWWKRSSSTPRRARLVVYGVNAVWCLATLFTRWPLLLPTDATITAYVIESPDPFDVGVFLLFAAFALLFAVLGWRLLRALRAVADSRASATSRERLDWETLVVAIMLLLVGLSAVLLNVWVVVITLVIERNVSTDNKRWAVVVGCALLVMVAGLAGLRAWKRRSSALYDAGVRKAGLVLGVAGLATMAFSAWLIFVIDRNPDWTVIFLVALAAWGLANVAFGGRLLERPPPAQYRATALLCFVDAAGFLGTLLYPDHEGPFAPLRNAVFRRESWVPQAAAIGCLVASIGLGVCGIKLAARARRLLS